METRVEVRPRPIVEVAGDHRLPAPLGDPPDECLGLERADGGVTAGAEVHVDQRDVQAGTGLGVEAHGGDLEDPTPPSSRASADA